MIFMGLMVVPLYYGVTLLYDKKSAILIVLLYVLLPYFIDFTRFFFGPVYLLSILAFLVLFMGLYKKYKKNALLFCVFILSGIIIQFHYQGLVVLMILFLYYLLINKNKFLTFFIALGGLILGISPLIVFELKNDFYNFKVLSEYLQYAKKPTDFFFLPHRYLSISLLLIIISMPLYKKLIKKKTLIILGIILFILDLFLYLPKPKTAFGMSKNWNYPMEKKAYEIIKKENLKDFNIVNHIYDNKSVVIKYHLKLDKYDFDYDDYYHNKYLFVISPTDQIFKDPAYEINTFQPSKKIKQWKLNDIYNLYLFQRTERTKVEK